jgi:hypothetical protein
MLVYAYVICVHVYLSMRECMYVCMHVCLLKNILRVYPPKRQRVIATGATLSALSCARAPGLSSKFDGAGI